MRSTCRGRSSSVLLLSSVILNLLLVGARFTQRPMYSPPVLSDFEFWTLKEGALASVCRARAAENRGSLLPLRGSR
jgi:hypothetical protein